MQAVGSGVECQLLALLYLVSQRFKKKDRNSEWKKGENKRKKEGRKERRKMKKKKMRDREK